MAALSAENMAALTAASNELKGLGGQLGEISQKITPVTMPGADPVLQAVGKMFASEQAQFEVTLKLSATQLVEAAGSIQGAAASTTASDAAGASALNANTAMTGLTAAQMASSIIP